MRNLISGLALAALAAAFMPSPALADVSCPPGSSAPGCAAATMDTAVTASFHGAPEAHNGKKLFAFEIRFSEDFDGLRLGAFKRALQVTGGRVVDVKRTVRGENGGVTVRVRPSSSGDLTITLAAGTAGGGSLTVPGPATASLPDPVTPPVSEPDPQPVSVPDPKPVSAPTPLTASFHGLPEKHDGKLISFEIRFSEDFDGLKLTALKQALQVTGGRVVDVKRTVRSKNGSVTVRVRPASLDPLGISLPATTDCAAAGAICTKAGGKLSASASANILSTTWGTGARTLRRIQLPPDQYPVSGRTISPSPPTYPGVAGTVVNMNSFGIWGTDNILIGTGPGQTPNVAPDFEVREYELASLNTDLRYAGSGTVLQYQRLWYQYPSVAKTNTTKTRVLVQVHKLGAGTGVGRGKTDLSHHVRAGRRYTEFFVANSFLDAKGTEAQPNVTATFTGHVIAVDSCVSCILTRGELIGGDASVTATVTGGQVRANISLTNLEATELTTSNAPNFQMGLNPVTYTNQTWTNLVVSTGSFSFTEGTTRKIQGSFRKQDNDNDNTTDLVDTVGAVFEVNGTGRSNQFTGGFVATLP